MQRRSSPRYTRRGFFQRENRYQAELMELLDLTFPTPPENLACDEALLDWREEEGGGPILRFWEPNRYFVVVGYANKVSSEANVVACQENRIPILRRCSGGGTVLQGPGCLNYSLILNVASDLALSSISSANRFIMERNRQAVQSKVKDLSAKVHICGHTDLAILRPPSAASLKFSGNAQRRRKHFLLFHGTFLLRFQLPLIEKYLPMPSQQPDYRASRSHSDFLTNLDLPVEELKHALRSIWNAEQVLEDVPTDRVQLLSRDKYVKSSWNAKF